MEEFPWHCKGVRHYKCKPCYAAYFKDYRSRKPEMFRKNARNAVIRKYGIEPSDYDMLLRYQHDTCAGCDRPAQTKSLVIDHDHATGKVRGLLCQPCNSALALLDNPELLARLTAYKANPPWSDCKGAVLA